MKFAERKYKSHVQSKNLLGQGPFITLSTHEVKK